MKLTIHQFDLPLRTAFTIARSTTTIRITTVVELSEDGVSGFGEVSDNSYYPAADPEIVKALMEEVKPVLAKASLCEIAKVKPKIKTVFGNNNFAYSALDMAVNDLAARLAQKPLYAHWGYEWDQQQIPVSNYTLSIDTPEQVLAQALNNPWPSYKVKLGGQHDLETLKILRKHLPNTRLCIDANAAWTVKEALLKIKSFIPFGLAFIEQPLPQGSYEDMVTLQGELERLSIHAPPLIADEDCQVATDIARCADGYDGVNIKLSKCGGPSTARHMVEEARALNLQLMFGCMVESSFAIGNLRHFAPVADFIDLDGALLINNDPASGVTFDVDGRPTQPALIGSGVRWSQ